MGRRPKAACQFSAKLPPGVMPYSLPPIFHTWEPAQALFSLYCSSLWEPDTGTYPLGPNDFIQPAVPCAFHHFETKQKRHT